MSDIVARLESYAEVNRILGFYVEYKTALDAVDEIKKLREELEKSYFRVTNRDSWTSHTGNITQYDELDI